jgi:hypothetical protein
MTYAKSHFSSKVSAIMLLLLSALVILAWSGCGKEESTGPPLDSFIGEWEATTKDAPLQGAEFYLHTHTMVFKADSTFTYHRETYHGGDTSHYNSAGSFSVQGNRLILSYTEPDETVGRSS